MLLTDSDFFPKSMDFAKLFFFFFIVMGVENLFHALKWPTQRIWRKNVTPTLYKQHCESKDFMWGRKRAKTIWLLEQNLCWGRWGPCENDGRTRVKDKSGPAKAVNC